MKVIKVNYNNVAIKKPREMEPSYFCYRFTRNVNGVTENVLCIEIDSKLSEDNFYENFIFDIYVDGILMIYINKNHTTNSAGRHVVEFINLKQMNKETIYVQLKGTYIDRFNGTQAFIKEAVKVFNGFVASEDLYCGENIVCNEYLHGYLYNNKFYTSKTLVDETNNQYEYDGEIDPETYSGYYIDIDTKLLYKWNSNDSEYQLLY